MIKELEQMAEDTIDLLLPLFLALLAFTVLLSFPIWIMPYFIYKYWSKK